MPTARNQVRAVSATASPQAQPQPQTPAAAPGAISNDMVFKVQQRLRDLGFYVRDNIDGQWGPNTSAAVRNFQRSKGMNASGQPDSATLAALDIR